MARLICLTTFLLAAGSAFAAADQPRLRERVSKAPETFATLDVAGSPYRLTEAAGFYRPGGRHGDVLTISVAAENPSSEDLEDFIIELHVLGPNGRWKGMHGFSTGAKLRAGGRTFVMRRISALEIGPDDLVYMMPVQAYSRRSEWRIDRAPLRDFLEGRSTAISKPGESTAPRLTATLRPRLLTEHLCASRCALAEERCIGNCTCGLQEFSCTCNADGGVSYTCKCYKCDV